MKKFVVLLFIAGVGLGGCKKSLDINQNPNQPTQVTPSVVLSAALAGSAANMAQDYLNLNRWMGYWSRSGNYVPDVQTETYAIPNDYTDFEWSNIYTTINRYVYIQNAGRQQQLPFYIGVAKVMMAMHFATLVDLYNDVPYTNALNVTKTVTPSYDKGQAIYNDLINEIDSSVIYFDSAKIYYETAPSAVVTTDNQQDIMFGRIYGSSSDRMDAWVRFANTLKLKLLLHEQKVVDPADVTAEIAKITNNGRGFIEAGESAAVNPGYTNSTGQINPFYALFHTVSAATTNVAYYRANSYAINFYNNTGDERQFFFYNPVGNAVLGNCDGDPNSVSNANTSPIGDGLLKSPSQDQLILSDFESLFLQAEAAQLGWITGDPETFYESAITQNYVYLNEGVNLTSDPAGDAKAYYTSGIANADWNASTDKMQAILTQKWASLNGIDWVEAYDDYRRTGIPPLPLSCATTHVEPQIPVRFLYPQVEFNTNGANVPQLGANAQFTAKVFWNQ